jgi:putative nucleotidyltransferase with HDIG domain
VVAAPSPGSFGRDEDVWFGGDDHEAEARAEQSVAALGVRIIGAKPFPVAAKKLEELTRNPKARLEQVVSVLETDPGLSVRLLRLVNSAGYGLKVRVTSVRHAAVLVGTRRLHQVATTAAILDLFATSNETAVELLEHATVVGSLCRYLAVHLGLPHDELFTCGFLHDIGKLMLLDTEGEKYAELVRSYGGGFDQLHSHERRMFGFDHAVLGAHVLSAWNIPEPIPKVVAFHHSPARAMQDPLLSSMVHTLRLADLMSYAVALDTETAGIALVSESDAARYLEMSEPQVAAMWSDIRALADRSRSRSNGQADLEIVAPRRLEVPRSLRPRRDGGQRTERPDSVRIKQPSLVPMPMLEGERRRKTSAPASSRTDINEIPEHFPCVACSKPSYGNVCAACRGQVCPEHQIGPDHWCVLCLREYDKFVIKKQIPLYLKFTGLALAVFSVGASITGAMFSDTYSAWKLVVAPLTMVLLWGILLPVLHRLWQRRKFLRTRPRGRQPLAIKLPRPNEVFISSLDANLESEGFMGPSVPPPSQAGISSSSMLAVHELPLPPRESGPASVAPRATPSPITDRSPVDPPDAARSVLAFHDNPSRPDDIPPSSDRDFDRAAEVLELTSDVMPKAEVVVMVEPPIQPPLPATTLSVLPSAEAVPSIRAPLRQPTEGLSEFPSVSTESELENVVASVSARLVRELLPHNDYMGPSAHLRPATIAPIPEGRPSSQIMPSRDVPTAVAAPAPILVEAVSPPVPVVVEAALTPAPAASLIPAPSAPSLAPVSLAVEATSTVLLGAVPEAEEYDPASAEAKLLVFPRVNLDQGCAPRTAFSCAVPIAESCSPAPRRTSLREGGEAFATSGGSGLRGSG